MMVLGLAGVVGGVVMSSGLLAVVGFVIMAGAVGVLLSTGQGTMPGSNPDSFTARMEERWRRRQSR